MIIYLIIFIFLITISYSDCNLKELIPKDDYDWGYKVYECQINDQGSVTINWGEDVLKISKTKKFNEFYIYLNDIQMFPSSIILDEGEKFLYKNILEIEHVSYDASSRKSILRVTLEKRPRILLRYGLEKDEVYPGEIFEIDIFLKNCGSLNARNVSIEVSHDKILTLLHIEPGKFFPIISPNCNDTTIKLYFKSGSVLEKTETDISIKVSYNYTNLVSNVIKSNYEVIRIPIKILGGLSVDIDRKISYPWDVNKKRPKDYAEPGEKIYITDTVKISGYCKKGYKINVINDFPSIIRVIGENNFIGRVDPNDEIVLSYIITSNHEIEMYHKTLVKVLDLCSGYEYTFESKPIKIVFKKIRKINFEIDYYMDDYKIETDVLKLEMFKPYEFKSVIKYVGNVILKNITIEFTIENSSKILSERKYELKKLYPGEKISTKINYIFNKSGEYYIKLKITYFDEYYNKYQKIEKKIKIYIGMYIKSTISYSIRYDTRIDKYVLNLIIFLLNEGPLVAKDLWINLSYPETFLVKNYEGLFTIKKGLALLYLKELPVNKLYRIFNITFLIPERGIYVMNMSVNAKDSYNNIYTFLYNYTVDVKRYVIFKEAKISCKVYFEKTGKNYIEVPLGYNVKLVTEIKNLGNETKELLLRYNLNEYVSVISGDKEIKTLIKPGEKIILFHKLKPIYYGILRNYLEIIGENYYNRAPFVINVTGKSPKIRMEVFFKENKNDTIKVESGKNVTISYRIKNVGDVFINASLKIENKTINFTLNPGEEIIGEIEIKAYKDKKIDAELFIKNFEMKIKKELMIKTYKPKGVGAAPLKIKPGGKVKEKEKVFFDPFLIGIIVAIAIIFFLILRRTYY